MAPRQGGGRVHNANELEQLDKIVGTLNTIKSQILTEGQMVNFHECLQQKLQSLRDVVETIETNSQSIVTINRKIEDLEEDITNIREVVLTRIQFVPSSYILFTNVPNATNMNCTEAATNVLHHASNNADFYSKFLSAKWLPWPIKRLRPGERIETELMCLLMQMDSPENAIRVRRAIKSRLHNPYTRLTTRELFGTPQSAPVFMREFLSPDTHYLFKKTKARARDLNYKFVWVRDGNILVRKQEGEARIAIKTVRDLELLEPHVPTPPSLGPTDLEVSVPAPTGPAIPYPAPAPAE